MATLVSTPAAAEPGRLTAACAGAVTYAFGFLTMAFYSLTGPVFDRLPTLWQSWGGTVGDTVLPFVTYSLVRAAQLLGPHRIHPASYALAAVGGLGGAGAQAMWLLDPRPHVNWMLVAPHTLSAVGWYHFTFLVLVSGFLAGTAMEVVIRARRVRVLTQQSAAWDRRLRTVLASKATTMSLTAVLIFAAAIAGDAVGSLESLASVGTAAGALAGPSVALLIGAAVLGPTTRLLFRPLLNATCVAALTVGLAVAFVRLI